MRAGLFIGFRIGKAGEIDLQRGVIRQCREFAELTIDPAIHFARAGIGAGVAGASGQARVLLKSTLDTLPATAELPAALKDKLAVCVACHGTNFNNTTDPGNPRLAGQHADYLAVALRSYQVEGNHVYGRANATMGGMAKPLSETDIKQIAAFLSGLPGELKTVPHAKFR